MHELSFSVTFFVLKSLQYVPMVLWEKNICDIFKRQYLVTIIRGCDDEVVGRTGSR